MWGSNDKIRSSKIETLVGQSIEILGDVKFSGGLHLDGKVVGNITAEDGEESVLIISDKGSVDGDVSVSYAIINGEVIGNVFASEKLELSGRARITGNVHYNLLEMASGAEVNGKMLHDAKNKRLLEHQNEKADDDEGEGEQRLDQAAHMQSS